MPCECACIHARTHKEFNLGTIIGAQRRTGKSYCYNAQIINHFDILLALSLYIPLKWCLAQIVRGQTLNRPGLKCRSQTPSPLLLKLHRTRQLTLDVLSEETSHQHGARLTSREIVSHSGNAEASLYLSHAVVSQCTKRVITNEEKKHLLISPCSPNQTPLANSLALEWHAASLLLMKEHINTNTCAIKSNFGGSEAARKANIHISKDLDS